MFAAIISHISSLIAGWIVSWLVALTFGLLNTAIAFVIAGAGVSVLARLNASQDRLETFTAVVANGVQFVTGGVEGFAKILLSLTIFSFFVSQPGLIMLWLFIAFQLIPMPAIAPEAQRKNMRAGTSGVIYGLLHAWWLYYPHT